MAISLGVGLPSGSVRPESRSEKMLRIIDRRLGLRSRAARRAQAKVRANAGTRPGWVPTDSMNYPRVDHTATLLRDGRVLVAGGFDESNARQYAEIYDPFSARWQSTGSMWVPRYFHTATLLADGRVLVAGGGAAWPVHGGTDGGDGNPVPALKAAEIYDPASGSWHQVADMNDPHAAHNAVLLPNGTVLVLAGRRYALTGSTGLPEGAVTSSLAEVYDPVADAWTALSALDIGQARSLASATALEGGSRILLFGGDDLEQFGYSVLTLQPTPDAVILNVGSDGDLSQAAKVDLAAAGGWQRARHSATLLPDGTVLLMGGENEYYSYDPDNPNPNAEVSNATRIGRFQNTGFAPSIVTVTDGPEPRYGQSATALNDGRVLIAGGTHIDVTIASVGTYPGHTLKDSWIYQSPGDAAESWTQVGSMMEGREGHTATLLPNRTVLVAGGVKVDPGTPPGEGTVLYSAEVFHLDLPDLTGCNPFGRP